MAIICWPMLRARRPGLRTSGSPLRYPTEPELPRYVRIEEQHKARSKKRAREDRVSAPAVQACGVCSRETAHLMVFTFWRCVHRPGWSRSQSQSQTGGGRKCRCCCPVFEWPVETDCLRRGQQYRLAACGPAGPVPQPAVPVSDSATCSIFHI